MNEIMPMIPAAKDRNDPPVRLPWLIDVPISTLLRMRMAVRLMTCGELGGRTGRPLMLVCFIARPCSTNCQGVGRENLGHGQIASTQAWGPALLDSGNSGRGPAFNR